MDKIKILAAALALAGCMENGMGMEIQEDMQSNRKPVQVILEGNTEGFKGIVTETDEYDIFFENVDFGRYNIANLYELISNRLNISFYKCNIPTEFLFCGFPVCYNAVDINFINCSGLDKNRLNSFDSFLQCGSNIRYQD